MLTNSKLTVKAGLVLLALTIGACGSSGDKSTGAAGHDGGAAGTTGAAGSDGGAGTTGAAGSDGGAGDGGTPTADEINLSIINGPGAFGTDYGIAVTRAAPAKTYDSCK